MLQYVLVWFACFNPFQILLSSGMASNNCFNGNLGPLLSLLLYYLNLYLNDIYFVVLFWKAFRTSFIIYNSSISDYILKEHFYYKNIIPIFPYNRMTKSREPGSWTSGDETNGPGYQQKSNKICLEKLVYASRGRTPRPVCPTSPSGG